MHSFRAYIDEAGDEGFTFRDEKKGSSEWFILSSCVIRSTNILRASRMLGETLDPIEERRNSPAHFANLNHDARVAVINQVSKLPIRGITICANKKRLEDGHSLGTRRRLYFYTARFLLERISWIARDKSRDNEGNGTCQLIFSHCKNLSYDLLCDYLKLLRKQNTQIAWDHLDTENIKVLNHDRSVWLRVADSIASGFYQGLELNQYGNTEDRFARTLKPIIYCNGGNYGSYGLKFFPPNFKEESKKDNRYKWLSFYE